MNSYQNTIAIDIGEEQSVRYFFYKIRRFFYEIRRFLYENNGVSDEEIKYFKQNYFLTEDLFKEISRNSGERYFNHLTRVLNLVLCKSENPTLYKFILAIYHDTLEDIKEIDFDKLKLLLGEELAFGVLLLTKANYKDYITGNDSFDKKLSKEKVRKYKNIRNVAHFSNMINFETFYQNALKLRSSYNLDLSNEKVYELCLEALEVKFFDRIDNLRDAEVYKEYNEKNRKKARRKIEETKEYFYHISQTTFPYIHEMIVEETKKLEKYLLDLEIQEQSGKINSVL